MNGHHFTRADLAGMSAIITAWVTGWLGKVSLSDVSLLLSIAVSFVALLYYLTITFKAWGLFRRKKPD